jgi:carboxymethylenebutenolidase
MARRMATSGYYVMLPNLYYRDTPAFTMDLEDPSSFDLMLSLNHALKATRVRSDVSTLIAHARSDDNAAARRLAVIGYCMSGPFALDLAGSRPDDVVAAASIFGVRLKTDAGDSPHLVLPTATAEIYVGSAEHDPFAPKTMVEELGDHLDKSQANFRIEFYRGEHGSVFPSRAAYDKGVAELHWYRLLSLLGRNLKR